ARDIRASLFAAFGGMAGPLACLVVYLLANRALGAAIRVFVRGPGEHIQMKLTGYPLPKHALIVFVGGLAALSISVGLARRIPRMRRPVVAGGFVGAVLCAALVPQSFIDNSIFWFPPALFVFGACAYFLTRQAEDIDLRNIMRQNTVLLVILLFSVASFLEVFPRSVRGLLIGTLPPAFILLAFMFAHKRSLVSRKKDAIWSVPKHVQFSVIAIVAFVFAIRMILPHYFKSEAGHLSFKADTELTFDRGRGVFLPAKRAQETDATVEFIS